MSLSAPATEAKHFLVCFFSLPVYRPESEKFKELDARTLLDLYCTMHQLSMLRVRAAKVQKTLKANISEREKRIASCNCLQ
jgi:hypothetical protein